MSMNNSRGVPVRTPDPLSSSRRRALSRLGSIRTMGLGAIGDIGSVAFGTGGGGGGGSVVWETATDWNNNTNQSGVVHENVANTGHTDDTIVKQGYDFTNPFKPADLVALWGLQESSGSTAYDLSGNGNDGDYNGTTVTTGPLDEPARDFDGTDDLVNNLPVQSYNQFSISAWHYPRSIPSLSANVIGWIGSDNFFIDVDNGPVLRARIYTGSNQITQTSISYNTWYFTTFAYDGTDIYLYVNGVQEGQTSSGFTSGSGTFQIGDQSNADRKYDGKISNVYYHDSFMTLSEHQDLYNVVDTPGSLTTAWKTLDTSATQLLTTTTIPANTTVDITVEQDTNSDGNADNTQTIGLTGGVDESNALSGFSDVSGRYRVVLSPDQTDIVSASTIDSVEVSA